MLKYQILKLRLYVILVGVSYSLWPAKVSKPFIKISSSVHMLENSKVPNLY